VPGDSRDLAEVLERELNFVRQGRYRNSARNSWRPLFVFEDSPTCLHGSLDPGLRPCPDCVLFRLVPAESRGEPVPCRRIPLNPAGETIDDLYRCGTTDELESALAGWLQTSLLQFHP
jgi:hypothetical protein